MKFAGKTAVVTGGSRDIGRAVCVKLGSEGANVVVNYNSNEDDADATVAAVEAVGGKAIKVKADVTKPTDVDALIAAARDAFGDAIHILVNNAGGLVARKTLEEMDEEFFNFVMQLNATSTFLACKAAVPFMGEGSAIVNLASLAGRDGGGGGAIAYATSKGAVMTMTRGLAKELGPKGIRVNAICPGMIATTFHDKFTPDAARENVANSTPLRRQGDANETADLVAYLASDEASFIAGANIDINGGLAFS
ncbi:glucose 1-dehydrogenase [Altererythrobacter sp.]|uniref:SDR family NAD(P)-dependent oxidoreductase n=1 Tax=Altererythrobacter sp. TaxID=1872480 RepID=UPI001B11B750|nr:glucose 1-dehydrogenase [Altererythrobacter sp.]MBO6610127.1 glucose 1-dehydrogenase [Altererythrobacter sp.]MBO6641876.1 glucose 1-dehydrogenase [Altererythrobacter sp.]MBO6709864.1 glucose 1-dehydrogenase [Altererythrobacter sp.]